MGNDSIAIYGCGGLGRELLPVARRAYSDIVFVSDYKDDIGQSIGDCSVISFENLLSPENRERKVCVAIGSPQARRSVVQRCEGYGFDFTSIYADSFIKYDNIKIGEGAVFCHYSSLTSDIIIGRHFQCNIYSYVAHDCVVGDFVTFAPRVSCNGCVEIGDDVYIGTGALIKPGIKGRPLRIGRGAVIGMGAVVTKDVPPDAVVVGNPARQIIKT